MRENISALEEFWFLVLITQPAAGKQPVWRAKEAESDDYCLTMTLLFNFKSSAFIIIH